jgi:hypothetical protein
VGGGEATVSSSKQRRPTGSNSNPNNSGYNHLQAVQKSLRKMRTVKATQQEKQRKEEQNTKFKNVGTLILTLRSYLEE